MKDNIPILKKIFNTFIISFTIFFILNAFYILISPNRSEIVNSTGILLTEVKKMGIPGDITDYSVEKGVTFFKEKSQILITFKGDDKLVFKHFLDYGQQNGWQCINDNDHIMMSNTKYSIDISKADKEYLLRMKFQENKK